jgi:KDEL-tailed cysteine endopeptidase
MKKLLLVALAGAASAYEKFDVTPLWEAWKYRHMKTYHETEESVRFAIFSDNHHKIMKWNEEHDEPKLAINKFADLTATEFKAQQAACAHKDDDHINVREHMSEVEELAPEVLPTSVDWRNKGAVTPVKDQGQCGSCWTFSTTGVIEGFYFVKNNELLSFSEQQIVDCDTDTNQGCNGGWPYLAVQYAAKNGLELETDYPYTAQDGTCQYNKAKTHQVASDYAYVTPKSVNALKTALVTQPVSILIEADQDVFQFYSSGVIKANCGANLDHAVLTVGYKKVGVLEAWIVKNSWGTEWGDQGYVYISTIPALNQGQGVCGILAQPVIAK